MSRIWTISVSLALAGCAWLTEPQGIEGAWRSNRELTLAGIRDTRTLTQAGLEDLAEPERFGHLVQVFHGGELISVAWGKCSARQSFRVIESTPSFLAIRFRDEAWGAEKTVHLDLEAQRIYEPFAIATPDLREVFTRVPLEEVIENTECVRSFVGE